MMGDSTAIAVALRVLEKLVEERARQPMITTDDMRQDVDIAWRYAEIFIAEIPPQDQPHPDPGGF